MKKSQRYVPLSTFASSTRFAIQPSRIGIIESGQSRGCVEVHLLNYDRKGTPAGGNGLAVAGSIAALHKREDLVGRLALVQGFNEVFEVSSFYASCVVLCPLGKGLGVHYELFKNYERRTSRKSRLRKKYASKAGRFLAQMQQRIRILTGSLDRPMPPAESSSFILQEETDRTWEMNFRDLPAVTLEDAKDLARARINELRAQGWDCGQESCRRGSIEKGWGGEDERTVAWLCKRADRALRVSIEKRRWPLTTQPVM